MLAALALGPPLEYVDCVVEPFCHVNDYLVLIVEIQCDALPLLGDHLRERLAGRKPLPR